MDADRMSIAFLAPSRDDEEQAPPRNSSLSSASSLSPRNPAPLDRICSRIDSHHDDTHPDSIRISAPPSSSTTSTTTTSTSQYSKYPEEPSRHRLPSPRSSPSPPLSPKSEAYPGSFRRRPRSPRPTYSEEQRFFVMFARLIQDKTWPVIEDDFATIFKQRSKGGLCSLYYRVRRSWGLEDVLKSDSNYWLLERRIIDERAHNFSRDFLVSIGYLR